jgi:choline kinase
MILLDSDIIFDIRIIQLLLESGRDSCLAVDTRAFLGEEEIKVRIESDGRIRSIGKEVPSSQAAGESIGIEKFSPSLLGPLFEVLDRKILREGRPNEFYEAAFQEIIDRGYSMYAVDIGDCRAVEIDTFEDIRRAEQDVIPFLPLLRMDNKA